MSFIWHGFNRDHGKRAKQCYYEWHCVVCYVRILAILVRLRAEHGR